MSRARYVYVIECQRRAPTWSAYNVATHLHWARRLVASAKWTGYPHRILRLARHHAKVMPL